jgi:hypothetical protein
VLRGVGRVRDRRLLARSAPGDRTATSFFAGRRDAPGVTPRTLLSALLLAAGALHVLAVPGFYSPAPAVSSLAVGVVLLLAGWVVLPRTAVRNALGDRGA